MSMQGWMNETRINVDRMPGWFAIAIVAQVWMYEWRSSFGQDECWVYGVIAICTGVWEFTDCYFCTWMLVCTILSTTVFEPVCPIVFTDRFRICDLPILCTTILHLPMWWTDCMIVCCMLFHTDVMQLLPRSKQISPLGDTINWLDLTIHRY